MQKFSFRFFLFCGLLVTLVYGIDFLIQEGLKKTDYREISKWNEVVNGGINADVLIVGSSRALVQFDTEWIENEYNVSSYNLGVNGSAFQVQRLILNLYLKNNLKPKKLFWIIDFHSFSETKEVFRYDQFSPYSGNPYIDSILNLNQNIDPSIKSIPLIRFKNNESLKYRGVLNYFNILKDRGRIKNGFTMPYIIWDGKFDEFVSGNPKGIEMPFEDKIFHDFLELSLNLKSQGIDVVWVLPPYYRPGLDLVTNWKSLEQEFNSKSRMFDISYLNYLDLSICNNKSMFYNASHLNKSGVEMFMNFFSKEVLIN